MAEVVSRRKIVRACKSRGWMVQATALTEMYDYFNEAQVDSLEEILKEMGNGAGKGTKLITEAIWRASIETDEGDVSKMAADDLEIINAFDTPRLVYDSMRKTFRAEEKKWSLLGDAADKINMMAQRYALVHQRVLRNEKFRRNNASYQICEDEEREYHSITPIESLLGKSNYDEINVVVLGMLVQVEESKFYLEDTTGRVQVSFLDATAFQGCYLTENAILLVEATFHDEILSVKKVGPPFVEPRKKSLQNLQQQVRHPHFLPCSNSPKDDASFVVLSDVHLDQPRVLTMLEGIFRVYENEDDVSDLPVFCLMGNFSSGSHANLQQGWEELATVLAKFQFLSKYAHFVFIPGPNDTRTCILPQPPIIQETLGLERTMQSFRIENVHWGSNPCRIRHNGKETVLFRHDTLSWALQNQIRLPDDAADDKTPHARLVRTMLHQGHLMPVANAPIYWNYDHVLRLFPLPDVLIMGGSESSEAYENYEGCDSIHAGSFARDGKYATCAPGSNVEMSTDSTGNHEICVEFLQASEESKD